MVMIPEVPIIRARSAPSLKRSIPLPSARLWTWILPASGSVRQCGFLTESLAAERKPEPCDVAAPGAAPGHLLRTRR